MLGETVDGVTIPGVEKLQGAKQLLRYFSDPLTVEMVHLVVQAPPSVIQVPPPSVNPQLQEPMEEINVVGFKDKYEDVFMRSQQLGHFTADDVAGNDIEELEPAAVPVFVQDFCNMLSRKRGYIHRSSRRRRF